MAQEHGTGSDSGLRITRESAPGRVIEVRRVELPARIRTAIGNSAQAGMRESSDRTSPAKSKP